MSSTPFRGMVIGSVGTSGAGQSSGPPMMDTHFLQADMVGVPVPAAKTDEAGLQSEAPQTSRDTITFLSGMACG